MGILNFLFGKKKVVVPTEEQSKIKENTCQQAKTPSNTRVDAPIHSTFSSSESNTIMNRSLESLVNRCLELETKGKIEELKDSLFQLYSCFNKPGRGKLIVDYKSKDNLALCFAFMLRYDWMNDQDIREVWAEDGFYCIMEYLMHQPYGRQGQAEAMIIFFTLLCVGRDSLKTKIQDILDRAKNDARNNVFHEDDFREGAQHVIDQISLLVVSGARDLGPQGAKVMSKICERYDGYEFFQETIQRRDLTRYNVMDVMNKSKFISMIIGSILEDC